jgi:protease II
MRVCIQLLSHANCCLYTAAKYVAKLRALKTDDKTLLLKVDMSAGHFSASDRYKYLRERAFEFAFVLDHIGAKDLVQSPGQQQLQQQHQSNL